jgi:two-component system response regulator YesN
MMGEFKSRSIRPKSLFAKLLTGFLAVILLLVAFNFISSIYLKNKIHNEIVKYNELSINHTVEAYENHFLLTKNMIASLNQNERWTGNLNILRHVKEHNGGYASVEDVKAELRTLYSNPFMLFENLIIHFKNDAYVLEKEGTSSSEDMFSKYYYSEAYPVEFWNRQFDEKMNFRVLPAAAFTEKSIGLEKNKGILFPIIVKTMPYNDLYFIVMLDAQKLFRAYHILTDERFYILNSDGTPIYTSSLDGKQEPLPAFSTSEGIEQQGDYYYFLKKGAETGFTYVSSVPTESITLQLVKLNMILITLLVVMIVISIVTSVYFSLNLNKPVRRIIESIQDWDQGSTPSRSGEIHEFDLISRKMSSMLKMNQDIKADLNTKTSLLRKYALTNKLKNIHMNLVEMRDLADTNTPFLFIIFQVTFKEPFYEQQIDPDKGTYYIREYIDSILLRTFKESVTFQIEQHQVMSLIFVPENMPDVTGVVMELKELFEVDHHLYLMTIAISPVYPAGAEFHAGYEEITALLRQRQLCDQSQLIVSRDPGGTEPFPFTAAMEEEFHTRLMSGAEEPLREWIARYLGLMQKKGASVEKYVQFAKDVALQLEKSLVRLNVPASARGAMMSPSLEPLHDFYSIQQYEGWFERLLAPATEWLQQKSDDQDPVSRFVMEYLDNHLHEDVNLDFIADKLNITSGYLSTYFKEKTGMNFSDYLNNLRIQRAKELLPNLELKIQDVAALVGYQNVNSFIRMFKRYSGVTPGEYRKKVASH